jgi:hypothetical protein
MFDVCISFVIQSYNTNKAFRNVIFSGYCPLMSLFLNGFYYDDVYCCFR